MATTTGAADADIASEHLLRRRDAWVQVMGGFVPGLATLEQALCRAAETLRGRAPSRVLDLGGGPGVLAERMARRWPGADVTLLDLDPVLLALARAALPDSVRALDADLSSSRWVDAAGSGYDLIAVVMTLHYLPARRAEALYADARRALAPGGLLVVADIIPDDGIASAMNALDPAKGEAAAELAWAQWWNAVADVTALQPLLAERTTIFRERPPAEFTAPASWHIRAARDAGFTEVGILWRCGRHAALAAIV